MEDYYSHVYGENWRQFAECLAQLGDALSFGYMSEQEPILERYFDFELAIQMRCRIARTK